MGLIISLVVIGLILIFAEILIIPGVGVAGVLGLLCMGGSCWYSFYEFGSLTGGIVTGAVALLLLILTIYILRAKTWRRMSLETKIDAKAVSDDSSIVTVGDVGRTLTRLSPSGAVRFGDNVVEARAVEGMIDPEVEVEVAMIDDNKIYVKQIS